MITIKIIIDKKKKYLDFLIIFYEKEIKSIFYLRKSNKEILINIIKDPTQTILNLSNKNDFIKQLCRLKFSNQSFKLKIIINNKKIFEQNSDKNFDEILKIIDEYPSKLK